MPLEGTHGIQLFAAIGDDHIPLDRISAGGILAGATIPGGKVPLLHDLQPVDLFQREGDCGAVYPVEKQGGLCLLLKQGASGWWPGRPS